MEKVKVSLYKPGKRSENTSSSSSEDEHPVSASEEEPWDYNGLSDSNEEIFQRLKRVFLRKGDRVIIRYQKHESREEEEKQ